MAKMPPARQQAWGGPWVEGPLEEGVAAYSSILAWRIAMAEEPGGLQSMGSQMSDTTGQRSTQRTQQEPAHIT